MTSHTQGEHAQPEALRLAKYVARRKLAKQLHADEIHGFDSGCETEAVLLLSDIEAVLAQVAAQPAAPQGGAYADMPEPDVRRLAIESGLIRKADSLRPTTWGRILRFARSVQALRASHGQAPAGASMEALRHSANEWADMAANGLQWVRNIADGISDPKVALENLEANLKHCREVNDSPEVQAAVRAAAATTAQPAPAAAGAVRVCPECDIAGCRHLRAQPPAAGAVAGPTSDLHPEKCPITGRPFFMTLDHPDLGRVPTYGGPYDSYTIPAPEGEPTDPWHERELRSERYDHDAGWWVEGGEPIPLRIVHEDVLFKLQEDAEAAAAPTPAAQGDAEDAARWRHFCARHPVTLVVTYFGNGCVNKTIEDAVAAIDADRAALAQKEAPHGN